MTKRRRVPTPDRALLAQAIHNFNITVGECEHPPGGIGDCEDRADEHIAEYLRLASEGGGAAALAVTGHPNVGVGERRAASPDSDNTPGRGEG